MDMVMSELSVSRRSFLQTTWAGAAGVTALANTQSQAASEAGRFDEPSRRLPLGSDADVIVCGAGPAGIAAALAAARAGAKALTDPAPALELTKMILVDATADS